MLGMSCSFKFVYSSPPGYTCGIRDAVTNKRGRAAVDTGSVSVSKPVVTVFFVMCCCVVGIMVVPVRLFVPVWLSEACGDPSWDSCRRLWTDGVRLARFSYGGMGAFCVYCVCQFGCRSKRSIHRTWRMVAEAQPPRTPIEIGFRQCASPAFIQIVVDMNAWTMQARAYHRAASRRIRGLEDDLGTH